MALLHMLWELYDSFFVWGRFALPILLVCALAVIVPILKNSDRANEDPPEDPKRKR